MKTIYARQSYELTKAEDHLFLVGPTPRTPDVPSWRPNALEILEKLDFQGVVFVPEPNPNNSNHWGDQFYIDQVHWEWTMLRIAAKQGAIVAWVPRKLDTMPAFTTNVEFGLYVRSGSLYYGRPDGAPNTAYLDALYEESTGLAPFNNLETLLKASAKQATKWHLKF